MSVRVGACPSCGGAIMAAEDGMKHWYHDPDCFFLATAEYVLESYEAWLRGNGRAKSPEAFKQFMEEE